MQRPNRRTSRWLVSSYDDVAHELMAVDGCGDDDAAHELKQPERSHPLVFAVRNEGPNDTVNRWLCRQKLYPDKTSINANQLSARDGQYIDLRSDKKIA